MIKDYRDKARGLSDLLNYCLLIEDGLILMKDGAFSIGWEYRGPDLNSSAHSELENIGQQINQTLCQLGDGWMLHIDSIRKSSPEYTDVDNCAFPCPTSYTIDQERSQQYTAEGQQFENHYYLLITYKIPSEKQYILRKYLFKGDMMTHQKWEVQINQFKEKIASIETSLSKVLNLQRLSSEDIVKHLHYCITACHHGRGLSKNPVYLDIILGCKDLVGGLYPKIGDKHICVLGISGFPLESEAGMLSVLEQLPISYRWSSRFILLDPITAFNELKIYRRNWFQKRHGLMGLIKETISPDSGSGFQSHDALEMTQDADLAIQEAESGLVRYGYYTSVIILMNEDHEKLHESAKLVSKNLEMLGFSMRTETVNAMEAYLGSLPGHGYQNIRKPMIHSLNLVDLLPLTGVWSGQAYNSCRYYPNASPPLLYAATSGHTPFRFTHHVNDVGHTLIVGDTGAGKSTLIGTMIAQHLRYPAAQVFLFDKGYSAAVLCHALEGEHYDIGGDYNTLSFYPFAHIDDEAELDWACEWVEVLLECQHITVTSYHRHEIREALLRLAQKASRTLTDYQSTVQDPEIKCALEYYTLSGSVGTLFDADHDGLGLANLQVFEMNHLMEKGEACVKPVLLYLFHKIENRLKKMAPSLIIIEEGHTFLKGRFGRKLNEWLREKRKQNVSIIFITQGLAEIIASEHKQILLNSCKTKIFLPNSEADSELNAPLYHAIGLNLKQVDIIKHAEPKRDYYYSSPLGSRLINLGLGPVILSFVGVDGENDRRLAEKYREKYQNRWVYYWLKHRKLSDWADYWLECYKRYKPKVLKSA